MTAQELIKKYQGESAYLHEDDAIAFAEEFALIQMNKHIDEIKKDMPVVIQFMINSKPIIIK